MPLYEYRCLGCEHVFERLVRGSEIPDCPACGATTLDRLPSRFAASSEQTRQTTLQKARRENLKTERDKAIAQREYEEKHAH